MIFISEIINLKLINKNKTLVLETKENRFNLSLKNKVMFQFKVQIRDNMILSRDKKIDLFF